MSYRTWGEPDHPAMLLLHGFLGATTDWTDLAKALAETFYLVAIDLPGHGKSQKVLLDGDPVQRTCLMIDDVIAGLGLSRFSVLGYSLGGRIALAYALSRPECITRLIIESAHPGLSCEGDRHRRWQSDHAWIQRFMCQPLEQVLDDWYQQPVFHDIPAARRKILVDQRKRQNSAILAKMLEAFSLAKQPDYSGRLATAGFPVHYLAGARDQKFKGVGEQLGRTGCLTRLHTINDCGHNIHREQPLAMAAVIRDLLDG
ncbi:2-succinyl-6-hydroxy-2,4-cyclohexadiene-1-carboxylate synthase [Endozoicomonas sp. Mp262]|uniref:2-succinyl-6-hydroxy-2, 4-cyclohexadiene-1-carboxylate synthase n=1 Tax=Endozoicomonas sp. Mp262 TaxID=2919499 RepID=UPI0021D9613A